MAQCGMLKEQKSIVEPFIQEVENLLNEGRVSRCISETAKLLAQLDQPLEILRHDMSTDKKYIDNVLNNIEDVLKNIMIQFYQGIFEACKIDVFVGFYNDKNSSFNKENAEYNNMCQRFGKDNELQVRIDNAFMRAKEIQNNRQAVQEMIHNIGKKIEELKK